jgi:hypothetical protein
MLTSLRRKFARRKESISTLVQPKRLLREGEQYIGTVSTPVQPNRVLREGEQYVCDHCRSIDFQTLHGPRLLPNYRNRKVQRVSNYDKDCAVCALWLNPATGAIARTVYQVRLDSCFWAYVGLPDVMDSFQMQTDTGMRMFGVSMGGDFRYTATESWNATLAQSWLQTCLENDGPPYTERLPEVINMALIDCESMTIVEADASSRWIALSYVWGETKKSPATPELRPGSQLPSCIPRTIEDAISVTKQIGYRFLWVDEYCIDQHNERRRSVQTGQMDEVYRHADLTIVAAAGNDKGYGLPGVNKTKRKRINAVFLPDIALFANLDDPDFGLENIKWFKRAWLVHALMKLI